MRIRATQTSQVDTLEVSELFHRFHLDLIENGIAIDFITIEVEIATCNFFTQIVYEK